MTVRVPFQTLFDQFRRVLIETGFTPDRAETCAKVFAENSRDGVYSHGLNSFPGFIERVRQGLAVDISANAEKVQSFGPLEKWDGRLGPGILNALTCMDRAISLAREHAIGCVALRNTNHWMRAGTYGLRAADAGCIGVCWTNTMPLMPPWGAAERKIGNNPIVFAIPRDEGHILLDMAVSQFSGGKTLIYSRDKKLLPAPGGYDADGNLTCDPDAILESGRLLPIGYWKGSGLALALDLVAALLSEGRSTYRISKGETEYGVSQVFIAIDVKRICGDQHLRSLVEETIRDLHDAALAEGRQEVAFPGERMLKTRLENLKHGIPVDPEYWQQVLDL